MQKGNIADNLRGITVWSPVLLLLLMMAQTQRTGSIMSLSPCVAVFTFPFPRRYATLDSSTLAPWGAPDTTKWLRHVTDCPWVDLRIFKLCETDGSTKREQVAVRHFTRTAGGAPAPRFVVKEGANEGAYELKWDFPEPDKMNNIEQMVTAHCKKVRSHEEGREVSNGSGPAVDSALPAFGPSSTDRLLICPSSTDRLLICHRLQVPRLELPRLLNYDAFLVLLCSNTCDSAVTQPVAQLLPSHTHIQVSIATLSRAVTQRYDASRVSYPPAPLAA
jgi:hypothetical protein